MATARITLTPKERKLRELLLEVVGYIGGKTELRFAGGWVRDKLLGIPSHDIDTAISDMTGLAFSMKMKEYLLAPGNLEKHGLEPEDMKSIHTILANPEKSKHLETTTTKIFELDVDFVNLRKETYSEDSRNPQMEFGTPEEDAERRDATINALFYNLHTDLVEDLVGGLDDLKAKLIKTPLQPKQTFRDDPLRVLRLIRFASRLDFRIADDCRKWMGDTEIKEALKKIISRERIGVEVEKMLKGNNPKSSLQYFDELGLYSTIFTDPTRDAPSPNIATWSIAYNYLSELKDNATPGSIYQVLVRGPDEASARENAEKLNGKKRVKEPTWIMKDLSWILAALTPWSSIPDPPPKKAGAKADPFGTEVVREGIKLPSKQCDIVTGAFRNRVEIIRVKDAIVTQEPWVSERDTLGMMIRKWGPSWKLHAMFALLVEAMDYPTLSKVELMQGWQGFVDHVEDMDLMRVATQPMPLDGKVLYKALGVNPGKWMNSALDVCMGWRLRNPDSKNIEEAIQEVRMRSGELGIPLVKDK